MKKRDPNILIREELKMKITALLIIVAALILTIQCSRSEKTYIQPVLSAKNVPIISEGRYQFEDLNSNGVLDPYEDWRLPDNERMDNLVTLMTLEEKASLVVGAGMDLSFFMQVGVLTNADVENKSEAYQAQAPMLKKTADLVSGASGETHTVSRLGINAMVLADGPAGLRISPTRTNDTNTCYCTAFPIATLLASTWDTEIIYRVGQAIGNEMIEYGVDFLLAPALNLHRNPLCGRNFGYYSEDPLITGKTTAAMVKGIQSQGVGATIKHFAANNAETNRLSLDTYVSERALRELYLEGFRIAVEEAQPWAVMSSYNKINGIYASESYDLLTKVLRDDWGFKGFVMTDWTGGSDPVAQMKAGNDMLMPGNTTQTEKIIAAVKDGSLDQKVLDRNVGRILNILLKTSRFKAYGYSTKPALKEHAELARKAGTDGMVLLKNLDKALPLAKETKMIAVFGNSSYNIIIGGTGSGDVNEAYSVSLVDGLKNAGYSVSEDLLRMYEAYIKDVKGKLPPASFFEPPKTISEMEVTSAMAARMAKNTDYAIITIGRNSGEGYDRTSAEGDFNLTKAEKKMIRTVADAFHKAGKKCVVILNVGGVVETASWRDIPDAILLAWQAGQETGNCIADVISGKVNPSGRLASTFPIRYEDVPSSANFPGKVVGTGAGDQTNTQDAGTSGPPPSRPSEVEYKEGIYVGYRYYDSFNVKTAYEFGYGLSYTNFDYNNLKLGPSKFLDKLTLSVDIKNTGDTAGREVVQLYISAPAGKMERPDKEMKDFAKTGLLSPGETQTVTFDIDARELASFDTVSSSWLAEAGEYRVMIGASSKDIRQEASFIVDKEITAKTESKALTPPRTIEELTRVTD
ncbi:MAG TPA: glycoside hydrolase family 3 C-terminal domain-containing protein [Desulfatiglandales bacterium]|nr:glycoside hydrolase family 3 C-terminal domain-containing protein [Desulfatiglandales bacterium]